MVLRNFLFAALLIVAAIQATSTLAYDVKEVIVLERPDGNTELNSRVWPVNFSHGLHTMNVPFFDEIIMATISLDYCETLMAAAGNAAHGALEKALSNPESFICVIEWAIPAFHGGELGRLVGRSFFSFAPMSRPRQRRQLPWGPVPVSAVYRRPPLLSAQNG